MVSRNSLTIPASRFLNRFVFSPLRSFLVIVLYELGFTPYEIGLVVALSDVAALLGSIFGPILSDLISRKASSALGRLASSSGLLLIYLKTTKPAIVLGIFLAQLGLLRGRTASYILAGESSENRVGFLSQGLAINDLGGLLGLLTFLFFLNGREAHEVFINLLPLRSLFSALSGLAILASREEKRYSFKASFSVPLRYLLLVSAFFFGVGIFRTFSPLYAKTFIGISDSLRGEISLLGVIGEILVYIFVSRLSPRASLGILVSSLSFFSLASLLIIFPKRLSAIIAFGLIAPLFYGFLRPSLLDFDISFSDERARGASISTIFVARRLGLISGRLSGSYFFVLDPRLAMLVPAIAIGLGGIALNSLAKRE